MAVVLAIGVWFVLEHTLLGIRIRSAGENPKATETQGVNVSLVRYLSVLVGGGFSAMAGAHLSTSYSKSWIEGMTAGPRVDRYRPDHFRPVESHKGHFGRLSLRRDFCPAIPVAAAGHIAQLSCHAALHYHAGSCCSWAGSGTAAASTPRPCWANRIGGENDREVRFGPVERIVHYCRFFCVDYCTP